MRTDELIKTLSRSPRRRNIARPATAIPLAVLISVVAAVSLSLVWLGISVDLTNASTDSHSLFVRLAFVAGVVSCACSFVRDLSVPGRPLRRPSVFAMAPFLFVGVLALHELSSIRFDDWPRHSGHAWLTCLWQIGVLAVPAFAILAFAVRHLAPTHLRRAGFSIGLASGGIGAMGYTLHANSDPLFFSLAAYFSAILVIAAAGAILGPKILRWS